MIGALSPGIERYLTMQERFEELRRRTSQHAGRKLCDLAYANSYDGPTEEVRAAIRDCLDSKRALDLQYTPYGGSTTTRRLIARRLAETHRAPFNWRDVILTPGAMAALNLLFRLVARPDAANEVVVIKPCWLDYPLYLETLGMKTVFAPMSAELNGLDLDALERALGPHTRAVVLSQPHNPTGRLFTLTELEDLAAVLRAANPQPLLISDECHRDFTFEPHSFVSPIECYDATCVVYSFGKGLFMQGQRIGYAAVSPRFPDHLALAGGLERLCRAMGFCTPTALMQKVVRVFVSWQPAHNLIAQRRDRLKSALERGGFEIAPSQATFFLYAKALIDDDFAFAEALAERSVLVMPSSIFHQRGYFRVSATASEDMIDRAAAVFEDLRNAPALLDEGCAA